MGGRKGLCSRIVEPCFVWAIWTGVMMLNIYLMEVIGRQAVLETSENSNQYAVAIHCYNWLGGLGWCILVGSFLLIIFPRTGLVSVGFLIVLCGLVFYITLVTTGFLKPNTKWRKYQLAKDGLAEGGSGFRGCWYNANPSRLTIEPNVTYYTLLDHSWTVDLTKKLSKSEYGWNYAIAPIVYTGPSGSSFCAFDPPIYASCISKSLSMKGCFWDNTGSFTTMRKIYTSEHLEWDLKNKVLDRYPGGRKAPGAREHVFEFNSQTREEVEEFVRKQDEERDDHWERILISWFTVTGTFFLLTLFAAVRGYMVMRSQEKQAVASSTPPPDPVVPLSETGSSFPPAKRNDDASTGDVNIELDNSAV